jgi:hypothetical protein
LPWLKKPRQRELEFEETSSFFLLVLVAASNASVEREVFAVLQIAVYIARNLSVC